MSIIDLSDYPVIKKSDFFRDIHVWTINEVLNYRGWLGNFKEPEDQKIACHILDFFIYYPKSMVDKMLRKVIGHAGYIFSSHFTDWEYEDFKTRCVYSFIPGETSNPTDSGHTYVRKLRNSLGIPEDRIVYNDKLYNILEGYTNLPIIFVDDFVGSGAQCDHAWNEKEGGREQKTLCQLSREYGHKMVYAPLVVNKMGQERINNRCIGLDLATNHVLDEKYNLFHRECICWKGDADLYNKGVNLILETSKKIGIPFTGGNSVVDVRGFGEQGLAIAFDDDGVPDAIPPIFYWCSNGWVPLIKKTYQR